MAKMSMAWHEECLHNCKLSLVRGYTRDTHRNAVVKSMADKKVVLIPMPERNRTRNACWN